MSEPIRHHSTGEPISVSDLPEESGVAVTLAGPVVPETWLGYSIRQFVGGGHFFTEFLPTTPEARKLCERVGQKKVLVTTTLSEPGIVEVLHNQHGEVAGEIAEASFQQGKALILAYMEEFKSG